MKAACCFRVIPSSVPVFESPRIIVFPPGSQPAKLKCPARGEIAFASKPPCSVQGAAESSWKSVRLCVFFFRKCCAFPLKRVCLCVWYVCTGGEKVLILISCQESYTHPGGQCSSHWALFHLYGCSNNSQCSKGTEAQQQGGTNENPTVFIFC